MTPGLKSGPPDEANPARFEPDLARSLGAQGVVLRRMSRLADAAASFREGANLIRKYAEANPRGPAAELLRSLLDALKDTEDRSSEG